MLETSPDYILSSKGLYSVQNLVGCSNESCTLHAHSICVASNNFIFRHPKLIGLTCFKIAHHPNAEDLWKSNSKFYYTSQNDQSRGRCQVIDSVRTDHSLYYYLHHKYGLDKNEEKNE